MLAACGVFFFGGIQANAVIRTWADVGSDFATNANWLLGTAPANNITNDIGSFGLVTNFQPNLALARSINGLAFTAASTNAVTLTGAVFTIGNSGINNQSTSGLKTISNNITMGAAQSFTNNGAITIGGNVTNGGFVLTLTGTGTAGILAGNLGGTGGLTKTGAGSWLVSGTNTYTGPTIVNNGTLQFGSNSSLANSAVTINATTGGTSALLDLNGSNATITTLTFGGVGGTASANSLSTGSGTLTLGGTVTFTATGNPFGSTLSGNVDLGTATRTFAIADSTNAPADLTVSANISGTGVGLTKTGAGTLVLSGNNSYTGATTVSAGVLNLQSDTALGATGGATTVASGAALQLQNDITVTGESLTVGGTGILATGAVRNISGNNTWTGGVALSANTTFQSDAGLLTFSGNITNASGTRNLTVTGTGDTAISGVLGTGAGTLTKTGAGTLTLSGANTYTGLTAIQGGTVSINTIGNVSGGASALGAPTTAANGTIAIGSTTTGATLQYTGSGSTTNRVVNLAGTTGGATLDSSGTGALNFTSAFTATGAGSKTLTLTGSNANANTISGAIVNNSAVNTTSLLKDGSGTWVLSGANTFTGSTTLNNGTLSINADTRLGTAPGSATANMLVFNGGTLGTTGTFTLSANRGTTLNAGGGTFDTASGTTLTYNGIIAGTGGLTKANTGTLVLGGANTYTGATTLNGGTLSINADNRLGTAPGSATADQLVFNGGTLATTATFALNANRSTTVNAGGGTIDVATGTTLTFSSTLSGAGTLTKAGVGTLLLGATNSLAGEFALNAGTLALNGFNFTIGTLHITGNSILDFGNSSASILNATNLIIDTGVTLTINNWVDTVDYFYLVNSPGSQGNPPLNQIVFSGYTGGNTRWQSYDHQVTPVPEPAAYGAALIGFSALLLGWRRRKTVRA